MDTAQPASPLRQGPAGKLGCRGSQGERGKPRPRETGHPVPGPRQARIHQTLDSPRHVTPMSCVPTCRRELGWTPSRALRDNVADSENCSCPEPLAPLPADPPGRSGDMAHHLPGLCDPAWPCGGERSLPQGRKRSPQELRCPEAAPSVVTIGKAVTSLACDVSPPT